MRFFRSARLTYSNIKRPEQQCYCTFIDLEITSVAVWPLAMYTGAAAAQKR
jgi:hypothetical protein